MICPMN